MDSAGVCTTCSNLADAGSELSSGPTLTLTEIPTLTIAPTLVVGTQGKTHLNLTLTPGLTTIEAN